MPKCSNNHRPRKRLRDILSKILRWEDPPARLYKPKPRETRYEIYGICEELIARPKEWAIIRIYNLAKDSHSFVWLLNNDRIKLPEGRFEFCARISPRAEHAVYARYIGP